ncbi:MAG: hypothetical protein JW804_02425 [Sedimentisphaerales bacterium]|nr:hypothetical protein [Sedimentisphaerales bacterium]
MVTRTDFEKTATTIANLNRDQLTSKIKNFKGRFRMDFTEAYLKNLSVDRLRHILLAAMVTTRSHN